jgi:release factor glutamine methyltransferase
VNDDVLDPRPDSETLIEAVLPYLETRNGDLLRILDLGTGSGCLILTLLAQYPKAMGVAVDVSEKALNIAKKNAQRLEVTDRINFMQSDWFESVEGVFDVIISNPPYIETDDINDLAVDVKNYDPMGALDGGEDGLNPYRVILPQIRQYLKKDGMLALEHGAGQSGRIKRLIENVGLDEIRVHHDLAGHDRVLTAIHK